MSYTQWQIDLGATAMKNFLISIAGIMGNFVPFEDEEKGSSLILNKWDQTQDVLACGQELYDAIVAAGYGDKVTLEQCDDAAGAVLAAVGVIQTRTSRPPPAVPVTPSLSAGKLIAKETKP